MTGAISKARPATPDDIRAVCGGIPGQSVRAWVLDIDGKPVGVAGYYLAGSRVMVFSDVIEDHGIPKTRIWRESLAFMQKLKMPAICEASEGAAPFLKRLGWKHIRTIQGREIYEWQNS